MTAASDGQVLEQLVNVHVRSFHFFLPGNGEREGGEERRRDDDTGTV